MSNNKELYEKEKTNKRAVENMVHWFAEEETGVANTDMKKINLIREKWDFKPIP